MEKCPNCGVDVPEATEKCLTCGCYIGPPNVRIAGRAEERTTLEGRYLQAVEAARSNGSYENLMRFAEAVKRAQAVINVRLDFLYLLLTADNTLHSSYSLAVGGQIRKPALGRDDQDRRGVEGKLFGTYGEEIRYAALSLDGSGLISYGPYAVKLREIAIKGRTTVLEENSYDFVRRHQLLPGVEIPPGYRAVWDDKHKLAVANWLRISPAALRQPISLAFSSGLRAIARRMNSSRRTSSALSMLMR